MGTKKRRPRGKQEREGDGDEGREEANVQESERRVKRGTRETKVDVKKQQKEEEIKDKGDAERDRAMKRVLLIRSLRPERR